MKFGSNQVQSQDTVKPQNQISDTIHRDEEIWPSWPLEAISLTDGMQFN